MTQTEKDNILGKAKVWFTNSVSNNHLKNAKKLTKLSNFKINPFTFLYLSNFLTGNSDPKSVARALIYPRVLGTSINTTFGNAIQKFTNDVLGAYASTTSGIDIEFIDQVDGHKKYCQLKSGPETINKDDVATIVGHFKAIKDLGRTNNLRIHTDDLIVGVVYGTKKELNSFYNMIEANHYHPVHAGTDLWHRLTGDENFYYELAKSISEVAIEADFASELNSIVEELAEEIKTKKILPDL